MRKILLSLLCTLTIFHPLFGMEDSNQKYMNIQLLKATQWRIFNEARRLVELGADVNCCEEIQLIPYQPAKGLRTPLLCLAFSTYGQVSSEIICDWLLENGADINMAGEEGITPLMAATGLGNVNLTITLLRHGASIPITTLNQSTVLHFAASLWKQQCNSCAIEWVVYHQKQRNKALVKPLLLYLYRMKNDPEQNERVGICARELYRQFRTLILPRIEGYCALRDLLNMKDS